MARQSGLPLVPGGAGAALKASRVAGFIGKLELIDKGINMAQGAIQARDAFRTSLRVGFLRRDVGSGPQGRAGQPVQGSGPWDGGEPREC